MLAVGDRRQDILSIERLYNAIDLLLLIPPPFCSILDDKTN
jgi:hypothetical protein